MLKKIFDHLVSYVKSYDSKKPLTWKQLGVSDAYLEEVERAKHPVSPLYNPMAIEEDIYPIRYSKKIKPPALLTKKAIQQIHFITLQEMWESQRAIFSKYLKRAENDKV